MSRAERNAVKSGGEAGGEPLADPLVRAALAVHREIGIDAQARAVLAVGVEWAAAAGGLAFAAARDGQVLGAVGSERGAEDPRLVEVGAVRVEQAAAWAGTGARIFEGPGPFDSVVAGAFAGRPARVLALALRTTEGRCVGLVLLALGPPPPAGVLERLERLEQAVRPALSNALQVLAIRELVIKDDTASCFNRRYFDEFLPEELARASRFRAPVSLIFLDMDNLKEVNNRHGHAMGSRSLYEVATRVRGRIRKFDKLFRFGGDEFCIVLPETDWHGAMEVAERVRDAIGGQPFLVEALGKPTGVRMSASLGIASFPLHARTLEELVQRADRAMQGVKRAGKNAIGVAENDGDR